MMLCYAMLCSIVHGVIWCYIHIIFGMSYSIKLYCVVLNQLTIYGILPYYVTLCNAELNEITTK